MQRSKAFYIRLGVIGLAVIAVAVAVWLLYPIVTSPFTPAEWDPAPKIDERLEQYGVPASIRSAMTDGQKQFLCDHWPEGGRYVGFDSREVDVTGDGEPAMTVSVMGIRLAEKEDGESTGYMVFPSFVWHQPTKIRGQFLDCELAHSNEMEASPNSRMRIYRQKPQAEAQTMEQMELEPLIVSAFGSGFSFDGQIGAIRGVYEGHGFLKFSTREDPPDAALTLRYGLQRDSIQAEQVLYWMDSASIPTP